MSWSPLRPHLVLFGDSITQLSFSENGWGARLADWYSRKADVVNRGFSGYNTRWCLELLPHVFPATPSPPRLVVVFLGANDASLADVNPRQHVPLAEYADNLRTIVSHVRGLTTGAAAPVRVLIVAPPPIDEPARLVFQALKYPDSATGVNERTNAAAGEYAQACVAVGAELGLPVVDTWSEFQRRAPDDSWRALLSDGLHLSPSGQELLFTLLCEELTRSCPELLPDALPLHFPAHTDVDPADPAASFALP